MSNFVTLAAVDFDQFYANHHDVFIAPHGSVSVGDVVETPLGRGTVVETISVWKGSDFLSFLTEHKPFAQIKAIVKELEWENDLSD